MIPQKILDGKFNFRFLDEFHSSIKREEERKIRNEEEKRNREIEHQISEERTTELQNKIEDNE